MANLRIVYNNSTDTSTLLTASGVVTGFPVTNLKSDSKGIVYRSSGKSTTLTLNWSTAQQIDSVLIPFCNFSPNATIRVRFYTEITDTTAVVDSGLKAASPYSSAVPWNWEGSVSSTSRYSYGGGTSARYWHSEPVSCKKVVISIADSLNTDPYIELSRLVIGKYWSPTYNTKFGLQVNYTDTSTHSRTESGNLLTDNKAIYKGITFDLEWLTPTDRTNFVTMLKTNGTRRPLFISIFPEDADPEKENLYQIYGKLNAVPGLSHPMFTVYTTQVTVEEM